MRTRSALGAAVAVAGVMLHAVALLGLVTAPAGAEPTGAPTPTATPTTATPSPTATATATDEPTTTATPTAPTPTPSETAEPTPTGTPTDEPTSTPTAEPATTVEVDDAVLRWGINNESNNRAFAPDTFNFFSAGRVPDPGRGGQQLPQRQWRQRADQVSIQKWDGRAWRPATWAGLRTDAGGAPLGSPTAGTFSGHTFVFTGGHGEVDTQNGAATISWDGDVTVLYYSGISFFYLSDPVLTVADGRGTLTARLSGFASSIDDPTKWEPVAGRQVTVATLPSVQLSGDRGFVARPAYRGVRVTGVPQVLDGPDAGAFPQSYIDFMDRLGTAAFWYSSGAATDPFKVALPVTVSYDAARTVTPPTPTAAPSTLAPVDNPTLAPPPPAAPLDAVPAPAPGGLPVASQAATDAPLTLPSRPDTDLRLTAAAPGLVPDRPVERHPWLWWTGGALLLAAALLLLVPAPRRTSH